MLKKKALAKKRLNREELYYEFIEDFLSKEAHQWIRRDKFIQNAFEEFFSLIPLDILEYFRYTRNIVFIPSSGQYGCTIEATQHHVVIVFPQLYQLLQSLVPQYALAILAHEVGHLVRNHSSRQLHPLASQVEADDFAIGMGFRAELEDFLVGQPQTHEVKVRLAALRGQLQRDSSGHLN